MNIFKRILEESLNEGFIDSGFKRNFSSLAKEIKKKWKKDIDEKAVMDVLNSVRNTKQVEKALEQVNKLISGFGVESVRQDDFVDRYWQDTGIIYINQGDTYRTTILFDTEENVFVISSLGDYIEEMEGQGRQFI